MAYTTSKNTLNTLWLLQAFVEYVELVTDAAFDMWTTISTQGYWIGPVANSGKYGDWAQRTENKGKLEFFEKGHENKIESLEAFIAMQRAASEARNGALITCFLHMLQRVPSWD